MTVAIANLQASLIRKQEKEEGTATKAVRSLAVLFFVAALSSCQTNKPKQDITPASRDGAWSAKTMIRDKTKRKTHQLDLDFIAQRPKRLRMEATTPGLGVHVASFALDGEEMSYILTRQKKFISGPAEPRVMKDLIQIALAPSTLVDLLFDRPLDEATWTCSFDDDQLPLLCAHRGGQLRVSWSDRSNEKRIVEIDAPAARLTMSLRETSSKVEVNDGLFRLSAPSGFQSSHLE